MLARDRQRRQAEVLIEPVEPASAEVWSRPDEWAARRTPEGCVICRSGRPLAVIAELSSTWVTAPRRAPLPGYVCVIARRHVNEPFEMDHVEQSQFWAEAMRVARAVDQVVSPIKMNHEFHGNTLPHVHRGQTRA
jgi:hypothetical protein